MSPRVLLLLLLLPAPVIAQEIGIEVSHWRLDRGTASADATTRTPIAVRLGLPVHAARTTVQATVAYAAERDDGPGLFHLDVELADRLLKKPDGAANLFIAGGVGALRFSADRQQAIIAECDQNPLCFFEGISYRSGWTVTLSGGLGAELPITEALLLQPTVRLVRLVGGSDAGPDTTSTFVRFGVGLTWRRQR